MDESEAYNTGSYDSYDDALQAAKAIVDEFLVFNWKKGMSYKDLRSLCILYGDDPIVVPDDNIESLDMPRFTARDFVYNIVMEFCKKLENQ
jgi:hypothetical protein